MLCVVLKCTGKIQTSCCGTISMDAWRLVQKHLHDPTLDRSIIFLEHLMDRQQGMHRIGDHGEQYIQQGLFSGNVQ